MVSPLTIGQLNPQTAYAASTFPPSERFALSRPEIESSSVFSLLRLMPKGASLHTHDVSLAPAQWVVQELTYRQGLHLCRLVLEKFFNSKNC